MAHLYRTYTTPSNETSWVLSAWIKKSETPVVLANGWIANGNDNSNFATIYFNSGNDKVYYKEKHGGTQYEIGTDRTFMDCSGWYHIFLQMDTTQATAANRLKMYVNNEQVTFASGSQVPQSSNSRMKELDANSFKIGTYWTGTTNQDLKGLMSHVHYIDSPVYDAYTPSTFGSTDATTGEWKLNTSPTVTYGTNGFFILKDNNSGTDQSGEGNNFSTSGTITNTEDCPSNVFATFNPLDDYYAGSGFANGNTQINTASGGHEFNVSTLGMNKGKFYWECKIVQATAGGNDTIGISDHSYRGSSQELSEDNYSYAYIGGGSTRGNGSTLGGTWASYGAGDIITVALDVDNNKLYFGKDGVWQNSGDPTSGATGTGAISIQDLSAVTSDYGQGVYFFAAGDWHDGASGIYAGNFGNGYFATTAITSEGTNASNIGKFEYDVPTGYTALCTKGLNE